MVLSVSVAQLLLVPRQLLDRCGTCATVSLRNSCRCWSSRGGLRGGLLLPIADQVRDQKEGVAVSVATPLLSTLLGCPIVAVAVAVELDDLLSHLVIRGYPLHLVIVAISVVVSPARSSHRAVP